MNADWLLARFVEWAQPRADVHGALLIGSRARAATPADEWSDVDLILVVEHPDRFVADERWFEAFGSPLLTFLEDTPVGGAAERRVLYDGGLDVDFAFFTVSSLRQSVVDPQAAGVLRRGHRVLVDKVGIADLAAAALALEPPPRGSDARSLHELGADFWYHALWAAKKLARGETLVAKRSIDGYLKELLLELFARHARAGDPVLDTWHEARFFERWADPRAVAALRESYGRYESADLARALLATADAFELFERETAARLERDQPQAREAVRALIVAALGDHLR
jgi:aminoglycoside 6-adenylyltransferase